MLNFKWLIFAWTIVIMVLCRPSMTMAEEQSAKECAEARTQKDMRQQEVEAQKGELEDLRQTIKIMKDDVDQFTAEQKDNQCAESLSDFEVYQDCQTITKARLAALDEIDRLRGQETDINARIRSLDSAIDQHLSILDQCSGCSLGDWLGEWSDTYNSGGNMILEKDNNDEVKGRYNGKNFIERGRLSADRCQLKGEWRHASPSKRVGNFCFNLSEERSRQGDVSTEPIKKFAGFWRNGIDYTWKCDSGTDWSGTKVSP